MYTESALKIKEFSLAKVFPEAMTKKAFCKDGSTIQLYHQVSNEHASFPLFLFSHSTQCTGDILVRTCTAQKSNFVRHTCTDVRISLKYDCFKDIH